jgi:hypothetical protein
VRLNPVIPGHREAMNPEFRADHLGIPRCAIAHLRFALARALSDKRYALARGMTAKSRNFDTVKISLDGLLFRSYFYLYNVKIGPTRLP